MKLHWNENLFGPLPGVLDAVRGDLDDAWMYPEEAYEAFRVDVAEHTGTNPSRVVPAHGTQSLIAMLASAAPSGRRRGGARLDLLPVRAVLRRPRSPGSPGADARARDRPRRTRRDRRSHPGEDRLGLRPEQPDRNLAGRHRLDGIPRRPAGRVRRGCGRGVPGLSPSGAAAAPGARRRGRSAGSRAAQLLEVLRPGRAAPRVCGRRRRSRLVSRTRRRAVQRQPCGSRRRPRLSPSRRRRRPAPARDR